MKYTKKKEINKNKTFRINSRYSDLEEPIKPIKKNFNKKKRLDVIDKIKKPYLKEIDYDSERCTKGLFDFHEGRNIYFIGDIHGDFSVLLSCLIDSAKVVEWNPPSQNNKKGNLKWIGKNSIVVFCGDICDRFRNDYADFEEKKIDGLLLKCSNGEIENEELMIYQFINYINYLAKKENGKLIKIFGNHEFMNYGPYRNDWRIYFENNSDSDSIKRYCNYEKKIGGNGNWENDEWAYATEFCRYIDSKNDGRCSRFAPGGDINKEIVEDNTYGIVMINNKNKKWIACHAGINDNILYGILEDKDGKLPIYGSDFNEVKKLNKSLKIIEDNISLWNDALINVFKGFNNFIDYKIVSSLNTSIAYEDYQGLLWDRTFGMASNDNEVMLKKKIPKSFTIDKCKKLVNDIENMLNDTVSRKGFCINCGEPVFFDIPVIEKGISSEGSLIFKHIQCKKNKKKLKKINDLSKRVTECVNIISDSDPDLNLYKFRMEFYLKFYKKLMKFYNKNKKFPENLQKDLIINGCCDDIDCDKFKNLFKFKKLDNSINLVVAHCVQPIQENLSYFIKNNELDKELETNRLGINTQCNDRIFRIDVSMSRAFDYSKSDSNFYNQFNNKEIIKCKQWMLNKRRPQVLHVKPDNSFEILECTYIGEAYDLERTNNFYKVYKECLKFRKDKLNPIQIYNSFKNNLYKRDKYLKIPKNLCSKNTGDSYAKKNKNYKLANLSFKKCCKNFKGFKSLKKKNKDYLEFLKNTPYITPIDTDFSSNFIDFNELLNNYF